MRDRSPRDAAIRENAEMVARIQTAPSRLAWLFPIAVTVGALVAAESGPVPGAGAVVITVLTCLLVRWVIRQARRG